MSFPRYPKYKASGVEWLGEVPAHWGVDRFRYLFRESAEKIEAVVVGPMLSVSGYRGIEVKDYDDENRRRLGEDLVGYRIVRQGQLVVNPMWLNFAGLGISDHEGHVSPAYRSYWVEERVERRYAHHLLRSGAYVRAYTSVLTGIRPNSLQISRDDLMSFPVLLPSVGEQIAIAAFLDRETAKIDALVAEQQRLVELLKEKRQAVISHAVTKGLNPDAPMKPSGVEWLGDVPAHWTISTMRRLCETITDGAHISPETDGGVYPFVSTKDVVGETISFETCLQTSAASFEYMARMGCRPLIGDVLFSKDGTIGRTVVVTDTREFVVASSLIIIRPSKGVLDPRFLSRLCQSVSVSSQVGSLVRGAGLPRLSIGSLLRVFGCFPPLPEQVAIVAFLDQAVSAFETLIAEAERTIALLQERRTALISAAVTGQIDVRGLAASEVA